MSTLAMHPHVARSRLPTSRRSAIFASLANSKMPAISPPPPVDSRRRGHARASPCPSSAASLPRPLRAGSRTASGWTMPVPIGSQSQQGVGATRRASAVPGGCMASAGTIHPICQAQPWIHGCHAVLPHLLRLQESRHPQIVGQGSKVGRCFSCSDRHGCEWSDASPCLSALMRSCSQQETRALPPPSCLCGRLCLDACRPTTWVDI